MKEKNNASIIWGIINIVLVILCSGVFKIFFLSTAMIILLWIGIGISVSDIKEGHKAVGITAFLLNGFAAIIYVISFGRTLLGMLGVFFR